MLQCNFLLSCACQQQYWSGNKWSRIGRCGL